METGAPVSRMNQWGLNAAEEKGHQGCGAALQEVAPHCSGILEISLRGPPITTQNNNVSLSGLRASEILGSTFAQVHINIV